MKIFARPLCIGMFCVIALLMLSCGTSTPQLVQSEWRIEKRNIEGSWTETLTVLATIRDEYGSGNIGEMWLLMPEFLQSWKIDGNALIRSDHDGYAWVQAVGLVMPDGAPFYRGQYTLTVISLSGERTSVPFLVFGDFPEGDPPKMTYTSGYLDVVANWPEKSVFLYDSSNALIASNLTSQGITPIDALFSKQILASGANLIIYCFDQSRRMAYASPAFAIKQ